MDEEHDVDHSFLMSIKAFSEFTGISQSTLRYYDKIGLFSPSARGENGYRYYAPSQITAVNFVQVMNYLKVPLKTVKGLAEDRDPEQLAMTLMAQSAQLNEELRRLSDLYALISVYQKLINEGLEARENHVYMRFLETSPLALGPPATFESDGDFHEPFMDFYKEASLRRINLAYPIGGYFDSMDTFLEAPGSPQRFYSLDPGGAEEFPGGRYLVGYNRGYYGEVSDLPQRLTAYAQEHELEFVGPVYNLFILDEVSIPDPNGYLLRASVAVKPKTK